MILDSSYTPGDGQTDVEICGTPYHGLALAGIFGGAMPVGGDTYRQQVPGIGAVVRTPEQAASDAANGYHWLDYLVLSGSNQQIYGSVELGGNGWIYCAGDGRRWHVQLISPASVSGNSATLQFFFRPFGYFPVSGSAITRNVTLADLGQASPSITVSTSDSVLGTDTCTVNTLRIDLDDIKPDGSAAVLGLRSLCPAEVLKPGQPAWAMGEPVSMGFLLVTITDGSGGPEIGVSVLHNRAATIGTYTQDISGETWFDDRILGVWFNAAGSPLPVLLSRHQEANVVNGSIVCPGSGAVSTAGVHTWTFGWDDKEAVFTMSCASSTSATCTLTDVGPVIVGTRSGSYNLEDRILGAYSETSGGSDLISASVWWMDQSFFAPGVTYASASHAQAYVGAGMVQSAGTFPGGSGDSALWAIKRISNQYFGFLAMRCDNASILVDLSGDTSPGPAQDTEDMVWIGGFTKAGKDTLSGDLGIQPQHTPTGSVHPLTYSPHLQADGASCCYY